MEREELQLDSESQATWLRGIATRLGESSYVVARNCNSTRRVKLRGCADHNGPQSLFAGLMLNGCSSLL